MSSYGEEFHESGRTGPVWRPTVFSLPWSHTSGRHSFPLPIVTALPPPLKPCRVTVNGATSSRQCTDVPISHGLCTHFHVLLPSPTEFLVLWPDRLPGTFRATASGARSLESPFRRGRRSEFALILCSTVFAQKKSEFRIEPVSFRLGENDRTSVLRLDRTPYVRSV